MQISYARFKNLILELDLEFYDRFDIKREEYNLPVSYRFVKGNTEFGEYYALEIIFDQYVYETYFIKGYEKRNLEKFIERGLIDVAWNTRPDAIKDADVINYSWEK
jgi:hypothetical protein